MKLRNGSRLRVTVIYVLETEFETCFEKKKNEKNEQKWPQLKKLEEKDNRI